MATPGGLVDKQELIDAQLDTEHLGRVANSKDASGNPISTSTNRTGGVNKTLDALETEYQADIDNFVQVSDQVIVDKAEEFDASIATKEAEADAAIDAYRLLSKGPYAPGTLLEDKFQYITYNGESYFATNPPYTTTAITPDADVNLFAGGYLTSQQLSLYTDIVYKASGGNSAVENMISGVPILLNVGETCQCENGTIFRRVGNATGGLDDYEVVNHANILDFGAVGDGSFDCNPSLELALSKKAPTYIPTGSFLLTSQIALTNNTVIFGDGVNSEIKTDGTFNPFYFLGTRTNHAKGLYISGVKYYCEEDLSTYLVSGAWFDDFYIENNFTEGCGLVKTGVPDGETNDDVWLSITSYDDLSQNIRVINNHIIGDEVSSNIAPYGIEMRYISNATISDNITNYCRNTGIFVVGCDADITRGRGFPGDPRWMGPVTISGNTGYKNGAAHIFCFGARHASVTGNTGMYCGDVGLDMEGCEDCIVDGNSMANSKNGNYSQFLYQRNVTYSDNVAESSDQPFTLRGVSVTPGRMFLDSISAADGHSRDIRLVNNQFRFRPASDVPSDLLEVWVNTNDSWVIEGNTFINCKLLTLSSNFGGNIQRNKFELTVAPTNPYNILELRDNGNLTGKAENPVIIRGNEIKTHLTTQTGDSRAAMNLNCESFSGYNYLIEDNICIGFGVSLKYKAGGSGNGTVTIRQNTFDSKIIDDTESSWLELNRSFVKWENNTDEAGNPYWLSRGVRPTSVSVASFIETYEQPSTHAFLVNGSQGVATQGVWVSSTGYGLAAFVTYSGRIYRSLISFPNLGNQPDTSPTEWEDIGPSSNEIPFYKAGEVSSTPV